jgi:2-polyprenyl-6-methoxyphenol hydroxylase-like FAD-dependent oxidoreductase
MTRVAIIGGGIGGLCLAQGLRHAGVDVTVYERTVERTDWLQGYRIHINPHGSRALHDCLEPAGWKEFLDTVSASAGGFGFATERLHDLLRFRGEEISQSADPAERHYGVSRISLRQILLNGMDDVVRLGKSFERYSLRGSREVVAHFEDGDEAVADLLIGADGANSRVRAQLLPRAAGRVDTGVIAIAGKHRLPAALPRVLTHDANLIVPKGRGSLFTAVWKQDRIDESGDYTFWGYADAVDQFPTAVDEFTGDQLRDLVGERVSSWAPALQGLVGGSDPSTVNLVRVRSATPVAAWSTGPVTLLGDAIHNMSPMGGIGANTALRDADLLRRQLSAVSRGQLELVPAVAEYERQMLDYGFAAVRRALRNTQLAGSAGRFGQFAFRSVLRMTNALPLAKRKMAASLGT